MGNEASLEGGEGGTVVAISVSAPSDSGQLLKPVNGAATGTGRALEPTTGMNRLAGGGGPPSSPMKGSGNPYKNVHDGPRHSQTTYTHQSQIQALPGSMGADQSPEQHVSRHNLQVDFSSRSTRPGHSPTVSPDRASAPTSPYSVPQIAPMPSSRLCPICNTAELTSVDASPNFNKCTQCQTTVCNQCGFNPNPHLTGVKEWLCLNCQMQRALGIDMTTPRSKSQQQIHSPSHQPKPDPIPKTQLSAQPTLQTQIQSQIQTQPKIQPQTQTQASSRIQRQISPTGPNKIGLQSESQSFLQTHKEVLQAGLQSGSKDIQRQQGEVFGLKNPENVVQMGKPPHPGAVPLPGLVKAQSQSDLGHLGSPVCYEKTQSAGNSPARQPPSQEAPPQDGLTKLFGFGASLLNQASTLISVDPLSGSSQQPSPVRNQNAQGSRVIFSDANARARNGPPGTVKTSLESFMLSKGPEAPLQKQSLQQQSPVHHQKGPKQQQSPTHHHTTQSEQQQSPLKQPQPIRQKSDVTCPLCKTVFNNGTTEPPNYKSCTQCHIQVCNLCGFNPTPHLLEKKEWLCLNCQTQRLMSVEPDPLPVPHSSPYHQPVGSPRHQQLSSLKQQGPKAISPQQKPPVFQQGGLTAPMDRPESEIKISPQLTTATAAPNSITTTIIEEQRKETTPKQDKGSDINHKPTEKKKTTDQIQTPAKDDKKDLKRSKYYEETSKTNSNQDLSRSPQSLSDTGYSSDGISSSHSEITALIQEEELKMNERGLTGHHTPPSPSELIKLESSMRPLLEFKLSPEGKRTKDNKREKDIRKHQSHSISISPEEYDSDEDIEGIMEEEEEPPDWEVKRELRSISALGGHKKRSLESIEINDEDFMRRQIMEMSADEENEDEAEEEDNEDEGYGYKKAKKTQKHISDSGKEKHHLTYHSSSFEEDTKSINDVYKGSAEEDLMASQGGLRRFKTIELNNSNSYSRDMELNNGNDLNLDREPELEMESLTGSPEERSRGEYSSTLPQTTSSYTSGISPTSISSMEDDSDSSPSRQRMEEAKQQRKARHRSHGPLLPTIEDSSEEDELREEEELLKEQEKMREVEQQRIRSTVRKTKRDKEELRAQRRRERSKTPPSNLSPIEDASPTEELRQAAEMEELHRSSCSEYSPSADSDAEGYEMPSKLYKSGSEYNLPTFMSLYSPTEKPLTTSSTVSITSTFSVKQLKSAEEVYEEMMKKAEMLQKQQQQQQSDSAQQYSPNSYKESDIRNRQEYEDEYDYTDQDYITYENEDTVDIYEEIRQTSQNISKQLDGQMEMDGSYSEKQLLDTGSAFAKLVEQSNALLTPGTSPTQLSAPVSFSETGTGGRIPDVRVTQHFSKDGTKDKLRAQTGKNGITPTASATTIAAYGLYARDTVTVSQTSANQTVSTTQPFLYGEKTGITATTTSSVLDVSHKIAAITQAYNQSSVRKVPISKGVQMRDNSTSSETIIESNAASIRSYMCHERSPPLSPVFSPMHSPTQSPSKRTSELSAQTVSLSMLGSSGIAYHTSPVLTQSTQTSDRFALPCPFQQSTQNSSFLMRTEKCEPTSPPKPVTVNRATSPLSSLTRLSYQSTFDAYSPPDSPPHQQQQPRQGFYKSYKAGKVNVGTSMVTAANMYTHGSLSMDNISLCHISTVPGTSRIEQGQRLHSGSVVDLRTAMKATPVIMADQGINSTSLSTKSPKYSGIIDGSPIHQSTTIQPLIMNLNTQEQLHVVTSTATTISVTVAASMFMSQPKQSVLYCDPLENRVDLGKGMGPVVCLELNKSPPIDPSIPKIDAKLEDLSIQQEQLLKQQQKLQQQQQLLEEQLQQHHQLQQQQAASFAKLNLSSRLPVLKRDMVVTQTSTSTEVNAISPTMASDFYRAGGPLELEGNQQEIGILNLANVKPHNMTVQMDGTAQGATITQLIKSEDIRDTMDLSGQIKSENQVTCCDIIYNLPFGGSCVGVPFSQKSVMEDTTKTSSKTPSTLPQLYQQLDLYQDRQTYQNCAIKSYTLPLSRRLQPSMSETNLGLLFSTKVDPHFQSSGDLFTDMVKDGYEGYIEMGDQYASYTDLHQGDVATLPIRRYSSMTNISSDRRFFPGDFAESNLAQYSATTAREISRMCAALNSIDRYSSNPDILQLSTGRCSGSPFRANLLQGPRHNLKYTPDGKNLSHSQALTDLINARQASLRAMYPSAIRSVGGIMYSTINTPIASTVPITTQPASVLQPLLRGVYRPYPAPNMTPVPLASLTRLPVVQRTGQLPFQYPTPNLLSVATSTKVTESLAITTSQNTPLYLGKSPVILSVAETVTQLVQPSSVPACSTTSAPISVVVPMNQPDIQLMPMNLSQPHLQAKATTQPLIQHQQSQAKPSAPFYIPIPTAQFKTQPSPSTQRGAFTSTSTASKSFFPNQENEPEERLHQQQEQLLQLEREKVELEKLRQLRLQEELEREREELQRDREKEQMLVQREIKELQTIKQQVLKQQQAEKENQLILQREQLAQQKKQLDQIQSLQQQLQQQLEEQKKQKSAATVVAANTNAQLIGDKAGKTNQPQEFIPDVLYSDVQVFLRPIPSSASDMCLRNSENQTEVRSMRKQRSMPRLQDETEGEVTMFPLPQRLVNSSVQTDDEDGEERYLISRRRRTRRSVDCSVQTDDDEDKAEWEQPVRRRRSRYSRNFGEVGVDHKPEMSVFATSAPKTTSSSIAIQTIRDCSCQTETEQLVRVSPSIRGTMTDPSKVEIVHYISGPERTQKGQSIACQTDPEPQLQNIVVPQISIATTVCPTSVQVVGSADQLSPSQQSVVMLARRKPDPLEFGYQQHHLHNESLSSLIRQQPKSPQVLYSPVSPLSSQQHTLETFSSSEKLNKAHVTPQQKSSVCEPPQRHQALPRPMKNIQRSLSDPKPLSPTTDENTRARISFYQQQALQSQLAALQQSSLLRKVKRTLPSPPPEETQLPMVAPNLSQMFVPTLPSFKSGSRLAAKTSLLKDLTHELKAVEKESTKLRKQQAELEEEEKEIDAKLRYLELGITQRKETLVKERERRELAYLRCMGDSRDYMSDSELNNLPLTSAATSIEGNGLLTRPITAPLSQFTCELNTAALFPPTTSFMSYQYPQSLLTAPTPQASTLQSTGFNQPPYPSVTQAQALPQPTPLQTYPMLTSQVQGTFPSQGFPLSQPPYPADASVPPPTQASHPVFQSTLPPTGATTYPTHSAPYPSQAPPYPVSQISIYQPQVDTLSFQQKQRQTQSHVDLEYKMPTNYELVSPHTTQGTSYSQCGLGPSYGQYSTAVANTYGPYSSSVSNTYSGSLTTSDYGPYTTTSSSGYGQYTTSIANTYGYIVTTASSHGQYNTIVPNTYGQTTMSDHVHSVDSPSVYSSEGLHGSSNLEHNVSRNYVMIDDICELTNKEGMGTNSDAHRNEGHGCYGGDGLHTRGGSSCGRPEDERDADLYDQHYGRGKSTGSHQAQGTNTHSRVEGISSMGGGSLYYYDDYRLSSTQAAYRHKSLCPQTVLSSRMSKHRKQSIEQKISMFSPIEEAHDVEADLASYTMSTSATSGYGTGFHYHKRQDDVYGLRSIYDPHWGNCNDDHLYGYGRSSSGPGYGMDKISSCKRGYSSRSCEGGYIDRSYHSNFGQSVHPSLYSQYSEKKSSQSLTKLMAVGKAFSYPSNLCGSSHYLPDVQDHIRDLPRTHVYEPDDMYIIDDMHCAVSDSEAYHLGQEETDWFEKLRDVRGSRHYGSNGHSSRRGHVKHTYHDYDEPPGDLWPQNDYGHTRHISSREHRHHGSGSSGRHSSHHLDEPRSSRSSRSSKDPSMRHDSRSLSSSGRRGDSRSQGYHSSDYTRDPSGQHHSSRSGKQPTHHQASSSRKQQEHLSSSRQSGSLGPAQKGPVGLSSSSRQPASQLPTDGQHGQRTQLPQQAQSSAVRPGLQTSATGSAQPQLVQAQQLQSKPVQTGPMARQPTSTAHTTPAATKPELATAIGAKAAPIQPAKTAQPPLTGIGSKASPRPGGLGSAAAGLPGIEGESMLSKILPGGAAEQAGKLGEAISGFGKKFTSLW